MITTSRAPLFSARLRPHPVVLAFLFSLFLFSLSARAATYESTVADDAPVGWWRFNDSSTANGQTASNSGSGSGIDGAYQGGVTTTSVGLPAGLTNAAVFNGTTSHLNLGFNLRDVLDGSGAVTLELWAKVAAFPVSGSSDFLFSNMINDEGNGFRLALNPTDPRMNLGGRSNIPQEDTFKSGGANFSGTTGGWHHVVGIMDYANDEIRIYVDTVLTTTSAAFNASGYTPGPTDTIADTIGARLLSGGGLERYFDGQLAEVAVYNYALGADRIVAHYNIAVIPEPGTLGLMLIAGLGLLTLKFRRRAS